MLPLLLLFAMCCKGNALYNPIDKLIRCCSNTTSNNKKTPTPMETTIIMFFKLCIFIIAPFQSLMEVTEELRWERRKFDGWATEGDDQLAVAELSATYEPSTVCICLPTGNKSLEEAAAGDLVGCGLSDTLDKKPATSPMQRNCDAINLFLSQKTAVFTHNGKRTHYLCVFFFWLYVMSICDTKIN